MKQYDYRFAGVDIRLLIPEDLEFLNEHRLAPFRAAPSESAHIFRFERVEALLPPEGERVCAQPSFWVYDAGEKTVRYLGLLQDSWENANIRAEHRGNAHNVQLKGPNFEKSLGSKTVLEVLAAEHLLVRSRSMVFHCSFIEWEGGAVLFTAPSETGKSTQADLWHRYRRTPIVNGDRAALRIREDGAILAEGIPFAGSSQYCENRSLPLKAIVYLAQSPRTSIRRLRGYEAFARVWEGVTVNTWDREDVELATDTVMEIVQKIPVYHMPCTPDEDAVRMLEQELRKLV